MDDHMTRLRRRTALYRRQLRPGTDAVRTEQYLKRVQYDTATFSTTSETPQGLDNLGPAYLRDRARHYHELADRQPDQRRAKAFRDLAATFEKEAALREKPERPSENGSAR